MPSRAAIQGFLDQKHLAFVGVSRKSRAFPNAVYRHMREAGYVLVPVNPQAETIEGDRCYASVGDVPDPVDGVVVMVNREAALGVVRECIEHGVTRIWLHRGLGSPGAMSDEAVRLCEENAVEVVAGACPLMFVSPTRHIHWLHKQSARRSLTP
jgi:predicted CoA-binding protein